MLPLQQVLPQNLIGIFLPHVLDMLNCK